MAQATTLTTAPGKRRTKAHSAIEAANLAIERLSPDQRIEELRKGFPAVVVVKLANQMGWSQEHAIAVFKLKRSTVIRKLREETPLDTPDSERLLSVMDMIEQVRQMVARSGDASGFDASKWLAAWLDAPNPALGGRPPSDYLDTNEGVQIVRRLLAQMETGAFA